MLSVAAPFFDGALIDGLADLGDAGGANASFGLVKIKASLGPYQLAMGEQSACLIFRVADHHLIIDNMESARWQDRLPMSHQTAIVLIIAAKLDLVIALILTAIKKAGEAGQACVHAVAAIIAFVLKEAVKKRQGSISID